MAAKSYYAITQLDKAMLQAGAVTFPADFYVALIQASAGTWTASTAYTAGQTILPDTANGHIYQCTTAGTSGTTEPVFPTTAGGTVTDGTAVWTEATDIIAGGSITEVSGGAYARVTYASNATNWPAPTNGATSNGSVITFPTSTASWGLIYGFALFDASTAGNLWLWGELTTPVSIASGTTPQFNANQLTYTDS